MVLAAHADHRPPSRRPCPDCEVSFRDGRPVSVEVTCTLRIARSDDDREPRVLRLVTE